MPLEKMTTHQKRKTVRGRPRPEDVPILEKKILDVALLEFLQHGYGGASINRIVAAAGISKTTLYSRFASKEELFRAIIDGQIERISPSVLLQSNSQSLNLEEGLRSYADHMLEFSLQGELLGVNRLIYSESHRFPELGSAAAERMALGIKRISRFIKDCAIADKIPCKDPEAIAQVFILVLRGWYVDVILTNQDVSAALKQRKRWVERIIHTLLSSRIDW